MGFVGYYLAIFLGLLLLLILPVGLMGATAPIIFHELKRDLSTVGRNSGAIFAGNTAGNLMGSLIGGIFLYLIFDSKGVFVTAAGLTVISVVLLGAAISPRHVLRASPLALGLVALAAFPALYDPSHFLIGTFRMQSPVGFSLDGPRAFFRRLNAGQEVKFYNDGPTGTVAVLQDKEVFRPFDRRSMAMVINGKSDSSALGDVHTLKLLAHIPALLAERKKKVMVVGLGTGVTAGELSLYPDVERIDVAEISPSVIDALPLFQEFTHAVHRDPRLRLHLGDAFRVLGRSNEKWDIVISEPSNPWVTGVDSLFTREFYRLVRDHLTEHGLFMQWFHTIVASPRMVAMALNTVQQEFKHLHVFVGSADLLILSSRKTISCDAIATAAEQIEKHERVRASLHEISVPSLASILIRELWTSSYVADYCSDGGIQSLDHPRLHYMAGKDFFMGSDLPLTFFLNSAASAYPHEYLINQSCGERSTFPNSKDEFKALLDAMLSSTDRRLLPLTKAVFLRAYLTDPNAHPLPPALKHELKTPLISFITASPETEEDWGEVGLEGATFRAKAEALLSHVENFRNWIVPYPLNGLMALLREGVVQSKDPYEKNWCALQMARLLLMEGVDKGAITPILRGTTRGADGQILLREEDRSLLEWFEIRGK
jgi:spermidine synthase